MFNLRLIPLLLLLAWMNPLLAQEDVNWQRNDYLCIKVKKNPAEYCNNKIFGKQDSYILKEIIKIQTINSKPVENKVLNYDRLQNLVRYGKHAEQIASSPNEND